MNKRSMLNASFVVSTSILERQNSEDFIDDLVAFLQKVKDGRSER